MPAGPKNSRSGRRRLGRGLGSLLNTPVAIEVPKNDAAEAPPAGGTSAEWVDAAGSARTDVPRGTSVDDTAGRSAGPTSIRPPRQGDPVPAAHAEIESKPVPGEAVTTSVNNDSGGDETTQVRVINLGLHRIIPNPRQPRQHFDESALDNLAGSIKREGLMQPILVRPASVEAWTQAQRDGLTLTTPDGGQPVDASGGDGFELIAGERRWRAAQRIGLATIPVIVHFIDDRTAAEFSLVENIQREDLDPIERAEAFRRLIEDFGMTHEEVAESVNLERATITNFLRLNDLDDHTRELVRTRALTMSHAKLMLGITNIETRRDLADRAARGQWSVRETEQQARRAAGRSAQEKPGPNTTPAPSPGESHMKDLQQRLEAHLGTKVQIHQGRKKGSGRLIIEFYNYDQFEGLMDRLGFNADS